jgi:hypothetical protein
VPNRQVIQLMLRQSHQGQGLAPTAARMQPALDECVQGFEKLVQQNDHGGALCGPRNQEPCRHVRMSIFIGKVEIHESIYQTF